MPFPVSARFLAALAASDQARVVRAEVWSGNTPLANLGTVTGGSVSVDVTQPIRRTCTLTVVSQGLTYDSLIPSSANSLLHPASGNELRIFRGFDYKPATPGVDIELCPLGVFRMTKPRVVDTGDGITITVSGNDRAALVSSRKWRDVYPIVGGTDLRQAVHDLVQSRVPELGLAYNLAPTFGITVPAVTFGTSLAGQNDPMADAISLAVAAPMELFFDEQGALVMQLIPDPATIAASFGSIYIEGVNCTFTETSRSLDETQTFNGVIVIGVGSGGAPVQASVWDTDPTSPTWVGGPWGYQPYIYQTGLIPSSPTTAGPAAYAQALSMARTLFTQVRTMLDVPEFQCVPNPALLESDGVTLVRARIGLDGVYTSAQMTVPLDVSTAMQVTCRPKAVPLFTHTATTATSGPATPSGPVGPGGGVTSIPGAGGFTPSHVTPATVG